MRPRLRWLVHMLFGQNFGAVAEHIVHEDPEQVGYEVRTPIKYSAHGMCDDAQEAYLAWVKSLPEEERV